MELPPAQEINGLPDALRALATGQAVTLLSAPGAALHAGAGWWRALVAQALQQAGRHAPDVLDCGDSPGRALEALSMGCRVLVLHPCPAFASVAERAARQGATVLPARPPVGSGSSLG